MEDKEEWIIRRIVEFYKNTKEAFNEVLRNTKGECDFHIDTSIFTAEQNAAFDRIADFLARMVEKYGPMLDDILKPETDIKVEKQSA